MDLSILSESTLTAWFFLVNLPNLAILSVSTDSVARKTDETRLKLLGAIAAIFALKGLGGSFHRLFTNLGIVTWHGPVLGTALCILLCLFFVRYRQGQSQAIPWSKVAWPIVVALIIIGGAAFHRWNLIQSSPLDPFRADMLPNVVEGFKDLDAGKSPYRPHELPNATIPHYYPPFLWAGFYLFHGLGLDIRYFTILCQAAIAFIFAVMFLSTKNRGNSLVSWGLLYVLLLSYLFSKLVLIQAVDIHTAAVGLYLVLVSYLLYRNRLYAAAVASSALILSREPAVLLVAPILLVTDKQKRLPFLAILLGLFSLVVYLFFSQGRLFSGFFHYGQLANSIDWQQAMRFYGLNAILLKVGASSLRIPLQLAAAFWPWILLLKRKTCLPLEALALGGASYTGFMLFVGVTFEYVFIEPIVLAIALALTVETQRETG